MFSDTDFILGLLPAFLIAGAIGAAFALLVVWLL